MKIAEVTPIFPPAKNGIGNVAYYNSWLLSTLGHEVGVFTPRYRTGFITDEYPFKVQRLYPWFKYGNAGILPQLFWKLPQYDLIHLHYPFFGGAEIIYFLNKFRDLKLAVTYHMDVVGTGILSRFFRWHTNHVMPRILDKADKIIITSWDYARQSNLRDRLQAEPEKFVEVPCGVNHLLYKPRIKDKTLLDQYELHDKKIILFVGVLDKAHYFKGLNILIQAASQMKDTDEWRVLVVGDGNLRDSYQSLAENLGLAKKIIFAGFVPDNILPKFYNTADMLVLPSVDKSEAFGMVALEAMASGLPVITSDLAGVRTVVEKQKTGLLVKPGSVDNLVKMIRSLLDNPRLAFNLGQAGRAKVLEKYTWDSIGYKLDNVLRSIK
ncbi:MAG: hypothetical protein C3F02_04820 [Parcubacteria group bacterium]|nr:MAG: hypothetical protein C3F02_04820 [Parcubacteria group bacterium]